MFINGISTATNQPLQTDHSVESQGYGGFQGLNILDPSSPLSSDAKRVAACVQIHNRFEAPIRLDSGQFLECGNDKEVRSIKIRGPHEIYLIGKNGAEIRVETHLIDFPNYGPKELQVYLLHSFIKVIKLSDGHFKIQSHLRLDGGVDKTTPLHKAVLAGKTEDVRKLIQNEVIKKKKYSIDAKDEEGTTALQYACGAFDDPHAVVKIDIVKLLVEAGADPELRIKNGYNAFVFAYTSEHYEIVRYLLPMVRNSINFTNADVVPVLICACGPDGLDVKFIQEIIAAGADPHATSHIGVSTLWSAALFGRLPTVRYLLSIGVNVNYFDTTSGYTALFACCSRKDDDNTDILDELIKAGANVNVYLTDLQQTPLMFAAGVGSYKKVEYLVSKDANINAVSKAGSTALSIACKLKPKNVPLVTFLLKKGADPTAILPSTYTTLDPDIRYLLDNVKPEISSGQNATTTTSTTTTGLSSSASSNHADRYSVYQEEARRTQEEARLAKEAETRRIVALNAQQAQTAQASSSNNLGQEFAKSAAKSAGSAIGKEVGKEIGKEFVKSLF